MPASASHAPFCVAQNGTCCADTYCKANQTCCGDACCAPVCPPLFPFPVSSLLLFPCLAPIFSSPTPPSALFHSLTNSRHRVSTASSTQTPPHSPPPAAPQARTATANQSATTPPPTPAPTPSWLPHNAVPPAYPTAAPSSPWD